MLLANSCAVGGKDVVREVKGALKILSCAQKNQPQDGILPQLTRERGESRESDTLSGAIVSDRGCAAGEEGSEPLFHLYEVGGSCTSTAS